MAKKENYDRHVYLYAKGHYQKSDMWEDLKKIYGKRNGIDPVHMNKRDVVRCMLGLIEDTLAKEKTFRLSKFIEDISPSKWLQWERFCNREETTEPYDFEKAVVQACLSMLGQVKCQEKVDGKWVDFLDLGEPDPEILAINLNIPKYVEVGTDFSKSEQRVAISLMESVGDGKFDMKDTHVGKS